MSLVLRQQELTDASLELLAERANQEYRESLGHLSGAMFHAIEVGKILLEARRRVGPNEWHKWVDDNLDMSRTHAAQMSRLAFYVDQIPPEAFMPWTSERGKLYQPSYSRVLSYIRSLPPIVSAGRPRTYSEELRAEIKELSDGGVEASEISKMLNVSGTFVKSVTRPDLYKRQKKREYALQKKRRRTKNTLLQEEKRRETLRLSKQHGGALSEMYSLVRRAEDKYSQVRATADTPERKQNLSYVITHLHHVEDYIGKTIREW